MVWTQYEWKTRDKRRQARVELEGDKRKSVVVECLEERRINWNRGRILARHKKTWATFVHK